MGILTSYGRTTLVLAAILALVSMPFAAFGQGLAPDCGPDCDFGDFIGTIQRIIDWLTGLASLIAALGIGWGGFMMLTSGDNPGKREEAKKLMRTVMIGFAIVLGAWLIVFAIVSFVGDPKAEFLNKLQ